MPSQLFKLSVAGWALMCWMTGLAVAGPLDRSGDGPRINPAVDDMVRIPGVLNMDYEEAMSFLQEAGLNPRVKPIKRVVPRYAGREGKVVFQSPLPGGIAMLGSTVSITYYLPPGFEYSLEEDDEGDYAEEGAGEEALPDEELTDEQEFHGKKKGLKVKGLRLKGPKVKIPNTKFSEKEIPKVKLPQTKGMKAIEMPKSQGMKIMPKVEGMKAIEMPKSQGIKIMPKAEGMNAIKVPQSQGMKIMPKVEGMNAIQVPKSQGMKIMPKAKGIKP